MEDGFFVKTTLLDSLVEKNYKIKKLLDSEMLMLILLTVLQIMTGQMVLIQNSDILLEMKWNSDGQMKMK